MPLKQPEHMTADEQKDEEEDRRGWNERQSGRIEGDSAGDGGSTKKNRGEMTSKRSLPSL